MAGTYPDLALESIADTAPGPAARYELREAVELAFVAAIQHLPARQRAVLLLCDVIGWSASEAARLLDTSLGSVNSALQRAHATLPKRSSGGDQRVAAPLDAGQRSLVARYVATCERRDLDGFIALLHRDATLSMPPWLQWYRGREPTRAFFADAWASRKYAAFRVVRTGANLQIACAVYSLTPGETEFRAHSIHVAALDNHAITILTVFINPGLFSDFALPAVLPA